RAVVHGRVQGVFFRSAAKKEADKLNLKGYVKNMPGGNVEVVAEGEKEDLRYFLDWCRKGPVLSYVEKVDAGWEPPTKEFGSFEVRY
ncbi:acylphosphatase, partial [Candidatus Woesearchaeota archaeon]|nr:acylphosphatase [Candidatus Woesearchaeota archaeon]